MSDTARRHSAPAERNREPILAELRRILPTQGLALEIAAGTGQHAAHFASQLPGWRWQPTDGDPQALTSVAAWCAGLPHVLPPQTLDVTAPVWPGVPAAVDLVYCANMIHIAPWTACLGLFAGAMRHLVPGGLLVLYGPYLIDGEVDAPGNLAFDADLRRRNPAWGVRQLSAVQDAARAAGLIWRERIAMPANNQLLVWTREAAAAGVTLPSAS